MASSALVIPASTTASSWSWLARCAARPAPGGRDGLLEEVGALVGVEERVEGGRVQLLCREALGVAVLRAVALAREARVVAVPVAVAHGRGPDEVLPTSVAHDESGQKERRGRRRPLGPVLTALREQGLDAAEELLVHEVLVGAVVEGVSEEDLADVDRVAQHGEDSRVAPGPTGLGPVAGLVQPHRERSGAFSAVSVAVEDDRHEWRLVGLGREAPGLRIDVIAEGPGATAPAAPGCLALHAGDHPVDDGGPLELGEHPEHLDHHPPRRRRRVEGLGRRAEGNPGSVEIFQELGEAAHRAREPVDPVDEEEVEPARPGLGQGPLQLRALGRSPRGLVAEAPGELPVGLALHVRRQPLGLGLQGVGLVVLVGRDPGVGGDSHGRAPLGWWGR